MKVLHLPAETGTGHNMRALAVAAKVHALFPGAEQHVYLGSKSALFTPMFEALGVHVHTASDQQDHANTSQLARSFDWTSYVTGYLNRTFISGDRMLAAIALIGAVRPDVVVSDYNVAACLAAEISGVPYVLVTERYDFTLGQIDNATLLEAGFVLDDPDEVDAIRTSLTTLFAWVTRRARAVLTDKPCVPELDRDTPVFAALAAGNGHVVGPIVRDDCAADPAPRAEIDARFGLDGAEYAIVGFGGTTMFTENKERLLDGYLTAFEKLRVDHPTARLVVIGRQTFTEELDGVVLVDYVADWHSLVKHSKVILSPPVGSRSPSSRSWAPRSPTCSADGTSTTSGKPWPGSTTSATPRPPNPTPKPCSPSCARPSTNRRPSAPVPPKRPGPSRRPATEPRPPQN